MGPLLDAVHARGESTYLEDQPVSFHRRLPDEEMFWTFSWSPLEDEDGRIAGALHPAVETTGRVLAERRLGLLRDLALAAGTAVRAADACVRAVEALGAHRADVPFAGVYLLDAVPGLGVPVAARLVASTGLRDVPAVFPDEVDLTDSAYTAWPLIEATRSATPATVALEGLAAEAVVHPHLPTIGLVVPLLQPGRPTPVALLALGLNPRLPLDDAHSDFLELLASQLATAVTTAALHEQQYDVALTLQRSMLPDASLASVGLDIATRYLPGASEVEVGGDWYDVVPLGAGRTALVIGDVMGRGVHAAAVMGQLRTAVRAYAQLDLPPARVLELLDRLVEHVSEESDIGQIVTCAYGVHDAGDATLTLASAGHPPAVLLRGGQPVLWEGPVGPPLGSGAGQYDGVTVPFGGGSGLLLYTDGLIEDRQHDIDVGLGRLLEAVTSAGTSDLERLADAALAVQEGDQSDDVALLAVRVPDAGTALSLVLDLRGDARASRAARRATVAALTRWGADPDVVDGAALVVAELVNNAVTHTGRPRQLRLRHLTDRLVVEVGDADPRAPHRAGQDTSAEGGRGLLILAGLTSDWGVRHDGLGKVVWCELALTTRPSAP